MALFKRFFSKNTRMTKYTNYSSVLSINSASLSENDADFVSAHTETGIVMTADTMMAAVVH